MPFMRIGDEVTDTGGNYYAEGFQNATFNGPYVDLISWCGENSLTEEGGMDWGGWVLGTNCRTSSKGGPGNTHAARSAWYNVVSFVLLPCWIASRSQRHAV